MMWNVPVISINVVSTIPKWVGYCCFTHIAYYTIDVIGLVLGFQLSQLRVPWFAHCLHCRHIEATYTHCLPEPDVHQLKETK